MKVYKKEEKKKKSPKICLNCITHFYCQHCWDWTDYLFFVPLSGKDVFHGCGTFCRFLCHANIFYFFPGLRFSHGTIGPLCKCYALCWSLDSYDFGWIFWLVYFLDCCCEMTSFCGFHALGFSESLFFLLFLQSLRFWFDWPHDRKIWSHPGSYFVCFWTFLGFFFDLCFWTDPLPWILCLCF